MYGVDDDKKVIYPLPDRHVDLLLFERNGIQLYTTIRNFSRLVSRQMSNHGHTVYCCKQCLHGYSTQELLDAHAIECCHAQGTKFSDDPRCRFTNIQKQLPAPFVVYADFESILKPVYKDVDTTQGVEVGGESSPHVTQEHILCSFAYKVVSNVDTNFSRPLLMYRGGSAAEKFLCDLQQEAKQLFDEYIATIWIALADLTRLNDLHMMHSLANCLVVLVRTRSIHMQLECGLPLYVGQWQITMTSTCSWMRFSQQTFLKSFVQHV